MKREELILRYIWLKFILIAIKVGHMNIEEIREYCLSIKGATESLPFIGNDVLVFKVMEKMFAFIALEPKDYVFRVNLKCNPDKSIELRDRYNGVSSTKFNPLHWNAVAIESDVPSKVIQELIQHSVEEVINKLPKYKRNQYLEES